METAKEFGRLLELYRACIHLDSTTFLLDWDLEVLMPSQGSEARGELTAFLKGETHRRLISAEMNQALAEAESASGRSGCSSGEKADIADIRRRVDRACKLPASLVNEMAKVTTVAQKVWEEAREKSDFNLFRPYLERIVELKRQEAAALGWQGSPYDPLLDEFEPNADTAEVSRLLSSLEGSLSELARRIADSPVQPYPIRLAADEATQDRLYRAVAERLGFDFSKGRLDISAHPFTERLHPDDTRITRERDSNNLINPLYSVIHEVGHALYEQGLPQEFFGLARGLHCSLGIHESQSRLWENVVGRSWPFCRYLLEEMDRVGVPTLGLSADDLYPMLNRVTPSLIRIEADEVTYNLHICLRFKLEKSLIEGQLMVADLPAVWNREMKRLLGIDVPTDRDGVLQDVHWSCGLFGYFPTYTLGNLYSAELMTAAESAVGPQDQAFAAGEFSGLLDWLRANVHRYGRLHSASQLMKNATGHRSNAGFFLDYLEDKYSEIYAL